MIPALPGLAKIGFGLLKGTRVAIQSRTNAGQVNFKTGKGTSGGSFNFGNLAGSWGKVANQTPSTASMDWKPFAIGAGLLVTLYMLFK